ncbi:hypothetical protein FPQ70_24345, partial [Salmonella enterica]|nr:hypothetical protein [Salmonella enterica]ECO4506801.1 hypothetical protein [Salmonella enterica]
MLTDLLVGRVQVAGGDQGGRGVFNTADGVRGEGGHGLAPASQGRTSSYSRCEKYTIHKIQIIHIVHTIQNLHTILLISRSDPKTPGSGSRRLFTLF